MRKIALLVISIIFIFTLCSCNDMAATETTVPKEIAKSASSNQNLKPEAVSLDSETLALDGANMKIIGASFDKATGDILKDSVMGGGLANETFGSGTARGFAIGYKNSDEEIKKMDAYLALFFEYDFAENASQRDSVKPNVNVKITDDQGQELEFIYNSLDEDYINIDAPFSVMLFKAYYDSKALNISINGTEYHLFTDLLK